MPHSRSLAWLVFAMFVLLDGGLAIAEQVRAAAPTYCEVEWTFSAERRAVRPLTPEVVLERKSGRIFRRDGDTWKPQDPSEGMILENVASGTRFAFRAEDGWQAIPSSGPLNVRDFGAKGDYDPATKAPDESDDTAAIQAAIDAAGTFGHHAAGRVVYVPAGRYRVTKTLNVTTDTRDNKHSNLIIRGDGAHATYFYGATGGILFDFTGSVWNQLEDFAINTHFGHNQSTVGIYLARGEVHKWAIKYRINRVGIHMHSDPAANNGVGTVGIWNFGGEHHTYNDIEVQANLPIALVLWRDKPEGLGHFIESNYVEVQRTNAASQHFTTIGGTSILVAFDYVRPCIYVNRAAEVRLDNTYLSMRRNPYNPQETKPGSYFFAVELNAVYQFYHHGMLEGSVVTVDGKKGPGYGYLRNPIYLDAADIQVGLAYSDEDERATPDAKKEYVPAIDLTPVMDFASGIYNSTIDIRYQPKQMPLPQHIVKAGENSWRASVRIENCRVQSTTPSQSAQDLVAPILRPGCVNSTFYDYVSDTEFTVARTASRKGTPLF